MITIDGSYGEGGGQILRTSLTLAALTNKPVRIINIRANRKPPGLKMQHITAARAVRKICRGELKGDFLGSQTLEFYPGKIVPGRYKLNIGTAGSTILVAQTILPLLLTAEKPSEIEITGGTFNKFAPGFDHFSLIFLGVLKHFGAQVSAELIKPGYYPKGNGKIRLTVKPSLLRPIENIPKEEWERAIIRIANLHLRIAIREKKVLVREGLEMEDVKIIEEKADSPGNVVFCYKGFRGIDVLGEKGFRAEDVAETCIKMLREEKGQVDRFTADQLLIYLALYGGSFTTSFLTSHLRTNAYVIEQFLPVKLRFEKEGIWRISVEHFK
jgi:RNA 3'-terminal phosphate cyclase (ATP)